MLCVTTVASSQNPETLPGRLVGGYTESYGKAGKTAILPVELTNIKSEGERVTGVVAEYRSRLGNCVSDMTPFEGTYKDGQLSIKSKAMMSQRADGTPCGGIVINVKISAGRAVGTFGGGNKDRGIPIELEAR
jgi:hypothetical protein